MFAKEPPKSPSKQGLIVILNGTSCAGKSTSRGVLEKEFGLGTWNFIECDVIEDKLKGQAVPEPEKQARAQCFKEAKRLSAEGKNVLIDIIVEDRKELEVLAPNNFVLALIYAPPAVLIERDNQRTLKHGNPIRAQAAKRSFILKSFCDLYQTTSEQGHALDSFNPGDCTLSIVGATGSMYYLNACIEKFQQEFPGQQPLSIAPRYPHDCVVNTATKPGATADLSSLCTLIKTIIADPLCTNPEQKGASPGLSG